MPFASPTEAPAPAPRVRAGGRAGSGWEFAFPAGAHSGAVTICGYREWGAPVRRRELPHPGYTLALSFGDPLRVDAQRVTSFVAGLYDRPVVTSHGGSQHGVQLLLPPTLAAALLRQPLDALANTTVELSDVLGPAADEWVERLAAVPDWGTRLALVEGGLRAAGREADPVDGEVRWALGVLTRRHGQVPVRDLVRETGWSQRHFTTRFRTQVGMAPKAYARVLRFQRAYRRMRAAPADSWARVAAESGYYDQPHLNREFRELAGLPPAALLAAAHPVGAGIAA